MRRFAHWVGCSVTWAFVLAGCDVLQALRPLVIDEETAPSPDLTGRDGGHGTPFIALPGGQLLIANPKEQGLKVADVRDPRRPRISGKLELPVVDAELFYFDGHAFYRTSPVGFAYSGARTDVDLPPKHGPALLNIDVSDRAKPTVTDDIPLGDATATVVQGAGRDGNALFVATAVHDTSSGYYPAQLRRYELHEGHLVETGLLAFPRGLRRIEAIGNKLLVVTGDAYGEQAVVSVIDGTADTLGIAYRATLSGGPDLLAIDGDKLRVTYYAYSESSRAPTLDTFDLTSDESLGHSGRCSLGENADYSSLDSTLFSPEDLTLYASNAGGDGQLHSFSLDDQGNCPEARSFGEGSRSYALQQLEAERLLAFGPTGLQLYDTRSGVLGSAQLSSGYYGSVRLRPPRPVQVFEAPTPMAAADGSPEPWLVTVLSQTEDPVGEFALLSASDHTLTPRATLSERGVPEGTVLYGSTLVTLASTQLRTFDLRDLQAPRALGQLGLGERYDQQERFGDYVARVRSDPWGPWAFEYESNRADLEVVRVDASHAAPIASLPAPYPGHWLKAQDLYLNIQWRLTSWDDLTIDLTVQAYDLSDPTRPRKAGAIATTAIEGEFSGLGGHFPEVSLAYRTVGRSLVFPQRIPVGPLPVRFCWKSIEYTVCPEADPSGCTPESYSGSLGCTTRGDDAESCVIYDLYHCVGSNCQQVSDYPEQATIELLQCSEWEEHRVGAASRLAVMDFQQPDQPLLVEPYFELEGASFSGFPYRDLDGTQYHHVQERDGVWDLTTIDFADPRHLTVSEPWTLPAPLQLWTAQNAYVAATSYPEIDLTLMRVPAGSTDPAASRTWPGRALSGLELAETGQLLLMHHPREGGAARWERLEILDAEDLTTIGALDLDREASFKTSLDGRLLIWIPDALLFVDIRDPSHPTAQAAIAHRYASPIYTADHRVYIFENGVAREYPIDLRNLKP